MEKLELEIVGLSYSQTQSGAYALVLSEKEGNRRLPIIIGGFEAQAIAIELEGMTPSRPLTHDLFKSFVEDFEIDIIEVVIYNLIEGIFFAKIVCNSPTGKEVEIDARTSDAIAIAVRFGCPIYAYEFILSSAGITLDEKEIDAESDDFDHEDETDKVPVQKKDSLANIPKEELEIKLEEAIAMEDYELASKIRDEINKREK